MLDVTKILPKNLPEQAQSLLQLIEHQTKLLEDIREFLVPISTVRPDQYARVVSALGPAGYQSSERCNVIALLVSSDVAARWTVQIGTSLHFAFSTSAGSPQFLNIDGVRRIILQPGEQITVTPSAGAVLDAWVWILPE